MFGSGCGQSVASLLRQLVRRKPLADGRSSSTELSRCLSHWHLMFYGVSYMAGGSIFVLIGHVVKEKSGPASVFTFGLCGLACWFTSVCYAELSTLLPRAGGTYTFTFVALGELPAFVVGWTMVSDVMILVATVSKTFSATVDIMAGGAISNFTISHLGRLPQLGAFDRTWDLLAVGLIVCLTLVNATGALLSMSTNIVLSCLQSACLLLIGVCCFVYGSPLNLTTAPGGFFPFGLSGILSGSSVAILAFSGFEVIANVAEECENPRRSLPIAIAGSLGLITVMYLLASLGLPYLTMYNKIDIRSPFVSGFLNVNAAWVAYVAAAGTLLATGVSKLTAVYAMPRFLYALASDGLVYSCFAHVNKVTKVPMFGLILGASVSCGLALVLRLSTLVNLVSLATLLSYLAVGIDLFVIRYLYFKDRQVVVGEPSRSCPCRLRPWAERILGDSAELLRPRLVLKCLFAAFLVVSLVSSLVFNLVTPLGRVWSLVATLTTLSAGLALTLLLSCYEPTNLPDAFQSSTMPLPALVSVYVNAALLLSLPYITWVRFVVWMAIGLVIYFTYGIRHSSSRTHHSCRQDYSLLADDTVDEGQSELSPISQSSG